MWVKDVCAWSLNGSCNNEATVFTGCILTEYQSISSVQFFFDVCEYY